MCIVGKGGVFVGVFVLELLKKNKKKTSQTQRECRSCSWFMDKNDSVIRELHLLIRRK